MRCDMPLMARCPMRRAIYFSAIADVALRMPCLRADAMRAFMRKRAVPRAAARGCAIFTCRARCQICDVASARCYEEDDACAHAGEAAHAAPYTYSAQRDLRRRRMRRDINRHACLARALFTRKRTHAIAHMITAAYAPRRLTRLFAPATP